MGKGHKDKVAVITGGANGIGQAFAKRLAEDGVHVAIADLADGGATVKLVEAAGRQALAVVCDVSKEDSVAAMAKQVQAKFGHVDIVVNCAGIFPQQDFSTMTFADWRKVLSINLDGTFLVTAAFVPGMRARKWGRVITSTSSGVVSPIPGLAISNALRMSLVGWSKTLAREVGRDGITANIVLPGRIATPRITFLDEQKAKREGRSVAEVSSESVVSIPVGRYGDPKEYAAVVTFLASVQAAYVTGSVVRIDGGLITSV